ncbi:hypoxia-associated factor, putative, partial [Ixodes scapularis]
DDDDALLWVRKSRKLQEERQKAEKRAKLLEEMDEAFGVGKLVEEELRTTKVRRASLALWASTYGEDPVGTLWGSRMARRVLDEGDDVLENVNLVDEERAERNRENKKGKPGYQPYDDTEVDEFGIVKKRSLLYKYDEEIEGIKQDKFKIGEYPSRVDASLRAPYLKKGFSYEAWCVSLQDSLVMPAPQIATEYYTPDEMVSPPPRAPPRASFARYINSHFSHAPVNVPQDKEEGAQDAQAGAPKARRPRATSREGRRLLGQGSRLQSQQFFVDANKASGNADDDGKSDLRKLFAENRQKNISFSDDPSQKSIVLNSTAEFCRTLGDIPTYGMSGNRDEEAEELMASAATVELLRALFLGLALGVNEWERPRARSYNGRAARRTIRTQRTAFLQDREKQPILEEEPDLSVGVSGALRLAVKKGYIETEEKNSAPPTKNSELHAQSYTIEEKFYDDDKASRRERYSGPLSEFREKEAYKPDVKLEYIDDGGRLLNAKEAFRYLSHKFHGKGSGKNKVDKRHKKLDQHAQKLKQMSSTDTPLSTLRLLQEKQKELQSPYILLSGGSKALNQLSLSRTSHCHEPPF